MLQRVDDRLAIFHEFRQASALGLGRALTRGRQRLGLHAHFEKGAPPCLTASPAVVDLVTRSRIVLALTCLWPDQRAPRRLSVRQRGRRSAVLGALHVLELVRRVLAAGETGNFGQGRPTVLTVAIACACRLARLVGLPRTETLP